jgi:hypothetical protein
MGPPRVDLSFSPAYRSIHMDAFFSVPNPGVVEIFIIRHESDITEALKRPTMQPSPSDEMVMKRIVECRLTLDPSVFKGMVELMKKQVEAYEKAFGEIKPMTLNQPSKRPPGTAALM